MTTSSVSSTLHAIEVSPPSFTLQRRYIHPKVFDSWASFVAIVRISLPRFSPWPLPILLGILKPLPSSLLILTTFRMLPSDFSQRFLSLSRLVRLLHL